MKGTHVVLPLLLMMLVITARSGTSRVPVKG